MAELETSSPSGAVVVPFELKANLIVVDSRLNDQPARLVFDTGASQTMIDARAASRVGVQSMEKRWARGAGGDIEVAVGGVRSLALDRAAVTNLTCIISDMAGISEKLGGGIDGVLGFDFNSRFQITIDYVRRELTLLPTHGSSAAQPTIEGNRFRSGSIGLELQRPDDAWTFETETPFPQIVLVIRNDVASVSIQAQELYGLTLEQLLGDIAESLPRQFERYERIEDGASSISDLPAHRFDFRAVQEGSNVRCRLIAAVANNRLWTITCIAPPERFDVLASAFQQILDSVRITSASEPRG